MNPTATSTPAEARARRFDHAAVVTGSSSESEDGERCHPCQAERRLSCDRRGRRQPIAAEAPGGRPGPQAHDRDGCRRRTRSDVRAEKPEPGRPSGALSVVCYCPAGRLVIRRLARFGIGRLRPRLRSLSDERLEVFLDDGLDLRRELRERACVVGRCVGPGQLEVLPTMGLEELGDASERTPALAVLEEPVERCGNRDDEAQGKVVQARAVATLSPRRLRLTSAGTISPPTIVMTRST